MAAGTIAPAAAPVISRLDRDENAIFTPVASIGYGKRGGHTHPDETLIEECADTQYLGVAERHGLTSRVLSHALIVPSYVRPVAEFFCLSSSRSEGLAFSCF